MLAIYLLFPLFFLTILCLVFNTCLFVLFVFVFCLKAQTAFKLCILLTLKLSSGYYACIFLKNRNCACVYPDESLSTYVLRKAGLA